MKPDERQARYRQLWTSELADAMKEYRGLEEREEIGERRRGKLML